MPQRQRPVDPVAEHVPQRPLQPPQPAAQVLEAVLDLVRVRAQRAQRPLHPGRRLDLDLARLAGRPHQRHRVDLAGAHDRAQPGLQVPAAVAERVLLQLLDLAEQLAGHRPGADQRVLEPLAAATVRPGPGGACPAPT